MISNLVRSTLGLIVALPLVWGVGLGQSSPRFAAGFSTDAVAWAYDARG
jgi:hypothetical protein